MTRLGAVLFWSVISAAFIGPGTVTTCAAAGAGYGHRLLWALTFSTLATVLLQEASARLTVISRRNLGQALRERYPRGVVGALVLVLVLGAIVLGCAAYQAGNILGAVVGASMATGLPRWLLTSLLGALAGILLWFNTPKAVARLLSIFVAIMGVAFLVTAASLAPPLGEVLRGSLVPAIPAGSGLLVLGLVGTTVVPYNLFLGSGIAGGQSLSELRFGIAVAVGLGGIISMGIVVAGTAVTGEFSYEEIARVLTARLGSWAALLFASGLCAAGLSSAITAPLAAAVTARGLFQRDGDLRWREGSGRYRGVWAGVLLFGLAFGLSGVRPIPAIIAAQAFNGVLLPMVAVFLLLAVNDRRLMGERGLNGPVSNAALAVTVAVTLVLGASGLARAAAAALGLPPPPEAALLAGAAALALLLAVPVAGGVRRGRRA